MVMYGTGFLYYAVGMVFEMVLRLMEILFMLGEKWLCVFVLQFQRGRLVQVLNSLSLLKGFCVMLPFCLASPLYATGFEYLTIFPWPLHNTASYGLFVFLSYAPFFY